MHVLVAVDGLEEERRYRRPLDPQVAAELLEALGVRGVVEVKQCWVSQVPGRPRRQAVLVSTRESWRNGSEDTGVPLERVYYLRHNGAGWYRDGQCRVLPNEMGEVLDPEPSGGFSNPLEEEVYAGLMAAEGW